MFEAQILLLAFLKFNSGGNNLIIPFPSYMGDIGTGA